MILPSFTPMHLPSHRTCHPTDTTLDIKTIIDCRKIGHCYDTLCDGTLYRNPKILGSHSSTFLQHSMNSLNIFTLVTLVLCALTSLTSINHFPLLFWNLCMLMIPLPPLSRCLLPCPPSPLTCAEPIRLGMLTAPTPTPIRRGHQPEHVRPPSPPAVCCTHQVEYKPPLQTTNCTGHVSSPAARLNLHIPGRWIQVR